MITSDYLEQVVDFDQPILVVGPGARVTKYPEKPPMDAAVLWFAERLAGRKGRLDILDLPKRNGNGGVHDPTAVRKYLEKLSSLAPLGEIRYLLGDVAILNQPSEEYGVIWDHGTLAAGWSTVNPENGAREEMQRTKTIIQSYQQLINPRGYVCLCAYHDENRFMERVKMFCNPKEITLSEDAYRTSLTHEQLQIGRLISTHFKNEDLLIPHYKRTRILEVRK